jgi:hypothetical protein
MVHKAAAEAAISRHAAATKHLQQHEEDEKEEEDTGEHLQETMVQ